jgi:cell wall-associated NlpC family hydrolase
MSNPRPGRATWAHHALAAGLALAICDASRATPIADNPAAVSQPSAEPVPTPAALGIDPVSRFLIERGLVGAAAAVPAASALAGQVREKVADMVMHALHFIGVPYRLGGNGADDGGIDCSGFTRQVFERSLGLILPRRAEEQARAPGLVAVERDRLQPGDLVFFNTLKRTFSHVGIYIGDGKFVHSPRSGAEVRVEDMRFMYWAKRFTGARRAGPVVEPAGAVAQPTAALVTSTADGTNVTAHTLR